MLGCRRTTHRGLVRSDGLQSSGSEIHLVQDDDGTACCCQLRRESSSSITIPGARKNTLTKRIRDSLHCDEKTNGVLHAVLLQSNRRRQFSQALLILAAGPGDLTADE